jgi:hypothetical protein
MTTLRAPAGLPPRQARRTAATVLTGLFAVLLPVALTAAWIRVTVISTSGYVAAVTPVAADPAVRAVVKTAATAEIGPALSRAIDSSLPSRLSFLAGTLGSGPGELAGDAVNSAMASREFQQLWQAANQSAHSQLISVLDGRSTTVTATGGQVVLNVTPMVNVVLKNAAARLSALTGRSVKAPVISQIPAAVCAQAARLTHSATQPASCGQIPLFPAATLAGAQRGFRILNDATLALLLLTPAAGAAALLAAPRRRRALLGLTLAGSATVLATAAALTWAQSSLIGKEPAAYQPAVTAILHAVTGSFFSLAWWHVTVGLILAAGLSAIPLTTVRSQFSCLMILKRARRMPGRLRLRFLACLS